MSGAKGCHQDVEGAPRCFLFIPSECTMHNNSPIWNPWLVILRWLILIIDSDVVQWLFSNLPICIYIYNCTYSFLHQISLLLSVIQRYPASAFHPHDISYPMNTMFVAAKNHLQSPFLLGGLEHGFYFSIYWECHHPNWLSYFSEG